MSNDQYPFISIVIASFNRKDIVEESIKSVNTRLDEEE